jgi:carbon-monoxide dehydrogenase large subunit
VLCVLTGKDAADDNIGGLICGWMIHSKDGSPMKAGPHPVLAQGKVRHVGDQVAVVVARTKDQARAAAELVQVDYKVLDAVVDPRQAQKRWCAEGARCGGQEHRVRVGDR